MVGLWHWGAYTNAGDSSEEMLWPRADVEWSNPSVSGRQVVGRMFSSYNGYPSVASCYTPEIEPGKANLIWLVVSTPLKNISQLGWWHSQYMAKSKCSKPPTSDDLPATRHLPSRLFKESGRFPSNWVLSPWVATQNVYHVGNPIP